MKKCMACAKDLIPYQRISRPAVIVFKCKNKQCWKFISKTRDWVEIRDYKEDKEVVEEYPKHPLY